MLKTININSAAVVVLAVAAFAHTPRIESDDVNRVASHIACRCGACTESVSCPMSKSGCSFCAPAKARIYEMQRAGIPDAAIIDVYRKEYGDNIYLSDPSLFYLVVPVFATVLGLLAVYWFIHRFKERAAPLAIAKLAGPPEFHCSVPRSQGEVPAEERGLAIDRLRN